MIVFDLNEFNNSGYNSITKACLSSNEINNLESEIVFPKPNRKMEKRVYIESKHRQTIEIGSFRETDENYPDICRTLRQNNK